MPDAKPRLEEISQRIKERFESRRQILTFEQYMEMVYEHPERFVRSSVQYLLDMIDFFGRRDGSDGNGKRGGYKVFDMEFADPNMAMAGEERVQEDVVRILRGFASAGRANKLILMHGPNGSSKSTFVSCLMAGLAHYSHTDEGALYRLNWIFPEEKLTRERIGFNKEKNEPIPLGDSYATLPEERIAAKIPCELRDSPLLLFPKDERNKIFEELFGKDQEKSKWRLPATLLEGNLAPRSKAIFDALLSAYKGDFSRVMQHVQVERWNISSHYKIGAVTIEPEMSVDAGMRQLTMDRSLQNLPPILQNLSLYQAEGRLVEANHGIIEFSDMLKRHPESFKYLLSATEKGTVNLDAALLQLDLVFIGSTNDNFLGAFIQGHKAEYISYLGRWELVHVPYLLDYRDEKKIYDNQLLLERHGRELAPHTTEIAALFAVLTRLKRPNPEHYPEALRDIVERINPLEKALFYADGTIPVWVDNSKRKEFSRIRPRMMGEFSRRENYEGESGASPREMKIMLLNASQGKSGGCITPVAVMSELRRMIMDKSVYVFLNEEADGDYHDFTKILSYLEKYYLDILDREIRSGLDLVAPGQYAEIIARYVENVSAWVQKRRLVDRVTGQEKDVDQRFMIDIEQKIAGGDDTEKFRRDLISQVGAYALEHPDEEVDNVILFDRYIKRLEDFYFNKNRKKVSIAGENLLKFTSDKKDDISKEDQAIVETMLEKLSSEHGYSPECTKIVFSYLWNRRYRGRMETDD